MLRKIALSSLLLLGEGALRAALDDGAKGTRKYGDILIDGVPLELD